MTTLFCYNGLQATHGHQQRMPAETFSTTTLLSILNSIAPFAMAEPWDNVGLMVGNPDQQVSGILVALDPTEALIHEALSQNLNTIITHHPLIFHPLKTIPSNTPIGRMLKTALSHDLAIIACHSNLDLISEGVSNALAEKLGLHDTRPLTVSDHRVSPERPYSPETSGLRVLQVAVSGTAMRTSVREPARSPQDAVPCDRLPLTGLAPVTQGQGGFGKIGALPMPMPSGQFLTHLLTALSAPGIQIAGKLPETIHTVALCGGSGSDLAETAWSMGAQIYITGEVKHSVARWAEAADFCVIDAGHYPTENLVVPIFAEILKKSCATQGFTPTINITAQQNNPMQWVVLNGP